MEYKTVKEWLEAYSSVNELNDWYLAELGWYHLFDVNCCIDFTKGVAAPLLEKLKGSHPLEGLKIMFTQSQHCKDDSLFECIKFLDNDGCVVFNITHCDGKWEVWDFRDNHKYDYDTKWDNMVFGDGSLEDTLAFFV